AAEEGGAAAVQGADHDDGEERHDEQVGGRGFVCAVAPEPASARPQASPEPRELVPQDRPAPSPLADAAPRWSTGARSTPRSPSPSFGRGDRQRRRINNSVWSSVWGRPARNAVTLSSTESTRSAPPSCDRPSSASSRSRP